MVVFQNGHSKYLPRITGLSSGEAGMDSLRPSSAKNWRLIKPRGILLLPLRPASEGQREPQSESSMNIPAHTVSAYYSLAGCVRAASETRIFRSLASMAKKRPSILRSGKLRIWRPSQNVTQAWPESILFGPGRSILLRSCGRGQSRQRLAVYFHGNPL